ncbi:MAG: signal peptidase I [Planctomycetota bacterium]|nr:signal peptidase I [Planctomycetota bacterium]
MSTQTQDDAAPSPKPSAWKTWRGPGLFVVAILVARFFLFEPFKIPSGSMEPTLIGHEDYGDRIVTNKIPYNYLGTEPKRFEVVVFDWDGAWAGEGGGVKKYIKRLVGLPGETLVISGGDLFLKDPATRAEKVLRKWEEASPELQERLWLPVSLARFTEKPVPPAREGEGWREKAARERVGDENRAAFPWTVEGPGKVERRTRALEIDGEAALTYAHPVRNVYVKMGHWPFWHWGCPAAHLPPVASAEGVPFKNPEERTENIRPYVPNSWDGVRCPNCGRLAYPLSREASGEPRILPTDGKLVLKAEVLEALPEGLRVKVLEGTAIPGDQLKLGGALALRIDSLEVEEGGAKRPAAEILPGQQGTLAGRLADAGDFKPGTLTFAVIPADATPFFYGGGDTVGDLKLDLELEVREAGGALELAVGSQFHQAVWRLSLGGELPAAEAAPERHEVEARETLAPGARHALSLAFVDGSVLAKLDGKPLPPRKLEHFKPLGADAAKLESLARVRFLGAARATLTRLDLCRDLHYTLFLDGSTPDVANRNLDPDQYHEHYRNRVWLPEKGRYELEIPKDHFLMLGDNSPSSKDGRDWGFVPRKYLVGRATLVWWPPTRWRMIH